MALHLETKHWIWIGVAGAGIAGLYLLSHRNGSTSTTPGDTLPQTGPPQLGNMTPSASPSSFDQGNQVASFLSSRDRYMQMAQSRAAEGISATGIVSKAWRQVQGGWEDIYHPGHVISESEAVAIGSENHGPYARGGGGFFGQVGDFVGSLVKAAAGGVAATYAVGQPITAGSAFLGPKKVQSTPRFTPGIAPSVPRAPSFGNPYDSGVL